MTGGHSPILEHWIEQARAVPIESELARRGVKLNGKVERAGPCPKCGGDDRFSINTKKGVFNCRGCSTGGDVIDLVKFLDGVDFIEACTALAGPPPTTNGKDAAAPSAREILAGQFKYRDESGTVLFAVGRYEYQYPNGSLVVKNGKHKKKFVQWRPDPDRPGKWIRNVGGVRVVPYRLPELIEAIGNEHFIAIVEGESKVDFLHSWRVPATCNAQGAGQWKSEHSEFLRGADVVILPDNDTPGRNHADLIATSLQGIAKSVRVLELPGLGPKQDIIDWAKQGGSVEQLYDLIEHEAKSWAPRGKPEQQAANDKTEAATEAAVEGISVESFYAYMPMHSYIYVPTREPWPMASVNARLAPMPVLDGKGKQKLDDKGRPAVIPANKWLDQNRPVSQMTWAPGEPLIIADHLISHGGWIYRPGEACLNVYLPPTIAPDNASEAGPWLEHVHRVYPNEAGHIITWLAHRAQRPAEKINHALVLGGKQGTGKDTLLEPIKHAVGPWNFIEVMPSHMLGRFNGFLKAVVLRINEARDLGEVNRYAWHDHMKSLTASPPDVLRVDEKNLREHSVLNCCSVIITTNHKTDGIYLPADDRRHFVAWSDLSKEDFAIGYWNDLWGWYRRGGYRHVAAYLRELDISTFDPKAPPPQTSAFWDIVTANRSPEDAELADALDRVGNPDATTLTRVQNEATGEFEAWLRDHKNRRVIPHRFESCGYTPVRNGAAKDGMWKINSKRQTVYAKAADLSEHDRQAAARRLTEYGK
jgi:hypothetical protein